MVIINQSLIDALSRNGNLIKHGLIDQEKGGQDMETLKSDITRMYRNIEKFEKVLEKFDLETSDRLIFDLKLMLKTYESDLINELNDKLEKKEASKKAELLEEYIILLKRNKDKYRPKDLKAMVENLKEG